MSSTLSESCLVGPASSILLWLETILLFPSVYSFSTPQHLCTTFLKIFLYRTYLITPQTWRLRSFQPTLGSQTSQSKLFLKFSSCLTKLAFRIFSLTFLLFHFPTCSFFCRISPPLCSAFVLSCFNIISFKPVSCNAHSLSPGLSLFKAIESRGHPFTYRWKPTKPFISPNSELSSDGSTLKRRFQTQIDPTRLKPRITKGERAGFSPHHPVTSSSSTPGGLSIDEAGLLILRSWELKRPALTERRLAMMIRSWSWT